MKIRAISLWEPWASLILTGAKQYETRSWATSYRGPLLICAAKVGLSKKELYELLQKPEFQKGLMPLLSPDNRGKRREVKIDDLFFGKAVAICDLTEISTTFIRWGLSDQEKKFGDYSPGRFAWKLKNVKTIEPFPVKGKQGLFEVELPEGIRP